MRAEVKMRRRDVHGWRGLSGRRCTVGDTRYIEQGQPAQREGEAQSGVGHHQAGRMEQETDGTEDNDTQVCLTVK